MGGDGRPVSLTLYRVTRGTIANFRIEGQPFWCNAIAESEDVIYDGMYCNATNTNPEYFYDKYVLLEHLGEVGKLISANEYQLGS